jgi:hypothetical protein
VSEREREIEREREREREITRKGKGRETGQTKTREEKDTRGERLVRSASLRFLLLSVGVLQVLVVTRFGCATY